jgi:SAM-dependent methyltransferase
MICRVCDSNNLTLVIDLGLQPWCNNFLTKDQIGGEPFYPLRVMYCKSCFTSQLDFTVKKEIMFSNHTYLSGTTNSLSNHFFEVAKKINEEFFENIINKSVLDIGSNDGTQLKHFKNLGFEVLGVESSNITSKLANDLGIATLNDFFNLTTMKKINKKFDVINASGVFFHLEELHSVCEGIHLGLKENGIFVVQFLYMKKIIENVAFDQIYHEHLLYYTLETIEKLLNRHKLKMFDAYLSSIHGGSIIAYVSHSNVREISNNLIKMKLEEQNSGINKIEAYIEFGSKIKIMKKKNIDYLESKKNNKKKIFGLGAPVKGNTLLNYFKIDSNILDFLVEKNPLRRNLYSPGMHIPIIMEDEIQTQPDIYYVLAWNFKEEILKNNQELIKKGIEFYFPVNP